jgi:hypothetical protein
MPHEKGSGSKGLERRVTALCPDADGPGSKTRCVCLVEKDQRSQPFRARPRWSKNGGRTTSTGGGPATIVHTRCTTLMVV